MTNTRIPESASAIKYLADYVGGFASISQKGMKKVWVKIGKVDERLGIFVEGTYTRATPAWKKVSGILEAPFLVEGVKVLEEGGDLRICGNIIATQSDTLMVIFTPPNPDGKIATDAETFVHRFYLPDSSAVPEDVVSSFLAT